VDPDTSDYLDSFISCSSADRAELVGNRRQNVSLSPWLLSIIEIFSVSALPVDPKGYSSSKEYAHEAALANLELTGRGSPLKS
jgi:hypothetical protein